MRIGELTSNEIAKRLGGEGIGLRWGPFVSQIRTDLPELASGDTVKVSAKVVEGGKERVQVFEGTVMRLRGGGITRSITVRKIASGVGVERTFMINSPRIEKIEVVRHGVARRAQLYFLRDRVGKAATLRERRARS